MRIVFNGQPKEIATGSTVSDLVSQLGLVAKHVAVEVNLVVVPRTDHGRLQLSEGDAVEVVTLVGGG